MGGVLVDSPEIGAFNVAPVASGVDQGNAGRVTGDGVDVGVVVVGTVDKQADVARAVLLRPRFNVGDEALPLIRVVAQVVVEDGVDEDEGIARFERKGEFCTLALIAAAVGHGDAT